MCYFLVRTAYIWENPNFNPNNCLPDVNLSEAKLLAGMRLGSILMQSPTLTFVNTVITCKLVI